MRWAIALCLVLYAGLVFAEPLQKNVTDTSGVLTTSEVQTLNQRLRGTQTVVYLTKSTNGISIEQYANDVFKANKIGDTTDNGLLFVVATEDRKMRIETGYGQEARLPDATTKSILMDIRPLLAKGKEQWFKAVNEVLNKLEAK